ncbi:MAG: aminopeptidase P family N-terminal domain-containing protein, partial [Acetobacteraceae bacterium]
MTQVSRRGFFGMTAAGAALTACARAAIAAPQSASLQPLTANAQPITAGERAARIAKVQGLMQQQKVSALLVEAGSSLDYFTGITWWRSERTTAALIPV